MKEVFTAPPTLLYLTFLILCPWLIPAHVYLCLRLLTVTPNGGLAWFLIVLYVTVFALCAAHFIWAIRQRRKLAVVGIRQKPPLWSLHGGLLVIKLLIGPAAALAIWGTMQDDLPMHLSKGKKVILKPEMQLRLTLKEIERRGIFTWAKMP